MNPAVSPDRTVVLSACGEFMQEWFFNKNSGIQKGNLSSPKPGTLKNQTWKTEIFFWGGGSELDTLKLLITSL